MLNHQASGLQFNIAALNHCNPVSIELEDPSAVSQYERRLSFYRTAYGKYESYGQGRQALRVATAAGNPASASKLDLEELCRGAMREGMTLSSIYQGAGISPGFSSFIQALFEYHAKTGWTAEGDKASAEFISLADQLLNKVAPLLPGYRVRTVSNPDRYRACSSRRDGVFIAPYWAREDYVRVKVIVPNAVRMQVQDLVHDWLQANNLKLAISSSH